MAITRGFEFRKCSRAFDFQFIPFTDYDGEKRILENVFLQKYVAIVPAERELEEWLNKYKVKQILC